LKYLSEAKIKKEKKIEKKSEKGCVNLAGKRSKLTSSNILVVLLKISDKIVCPTYLTIF